MLTIALTLVLLLAVVYGAYHYMLSVPGTPHQGALPPLTPEERDLAARLRRHEALPLRRYLHAQRRRRR